MGGPSIQAQTFQSPTTSSQPQRTKAKTSKGIRGYPDGWRQVLNSAKDIVWCSVLLKDPFPGPGQAQITTNECFHEALTTECENGLVVENGMSPADLISNLLTHPYQTGFSWSEEMMSIVST